MSIGQQSCLTASVEPDTATETGVTWESNNAAVATVSSDGTVTAVGTGSAVITATTVDGGYTAVCTVMVQSPTTVRREERKAVARETETIQTIARRRRRVRTQIVQDRVNLHRTTRTGVMARIHRPGKDRIMRKQTYRRSMRPNRQRRIKTEMWRWSRKV